MLFRSGLVQDRDGRLGLTRDGCFWGYNITALLTEAIADDLASAAAPSTPEFSSTLAT